MTFWDSTEGARSRYEYEGEMAVVAEEGVPFRGEGVGSGAVRVFRKAPRRGLVRILRGISSKIEEKVSL